MSRHRMVRNLSADDYYDDDYDDYYDEDDYEDYDSTFVAPKKTPSKPAAPKPATTISAKVALAGQKKPAVAKPTTPATGIVKPPPGWGKPSTAVTPPSASTASAGISKPPPGWGKPSPGAAPGIAKPPPGWGKPTTATTATISSSSTPSTKPTVSTVDSSPEKPMTATSSKASSSKQEQPQQQQRQQRQQQQPYKSKPLPPFLQQRNGISSQLSMVVLGHVDAGKSTLMGQLLLQTGQVSKRQAQKQSLAWLLDENQSEQERGVTMEIGTKALTTQNHQIVVLDAPGHQDYIPVMITGAANADTAILVVDAVTGEFESGFSGGGQTKEHILLAKGLGVSQVIVAVNKLDVEGWKQERYEFVQQSVVDYLIQQRFKAPRIQCVPVSGLTGENVQCQSEPLLREWYQGPTLLQAIDRFKPANRQLDKPLRFIVNDMYGEGKGVVVRGRVVQGFVQVGDKVRVLPLGDPASISKLEHLQAPTEHNSDRLSVAIAGDTAELVLANVDPLRVTVGTIVVDPTHLPPIAKRAKAKILVMDNLTVPIIRGAQVLFHMHSIDVPAALTKLIALLKPDGSTLKERPRALTSGSSAMVELKLSDNTKIVMDTFQECRALGRFVLRRGGDTIAVGVIEETIF